MDAEIQRHWVAGALESLSADQRQLLELYYFAELTLPEIAVALNKPVNSVKYQFYRAHKNVSDYMNPPVEGRGVSEISGRRASNEV